MTAASDKEEPRSWDSRSCDSDESRRRARRRPADQGRTAIDSLVADVHDGNDRPAAVRPLVHRVDRDEDGRIADGGRGDAADGGLGMAVVVDVRVIEHDLAPAAQL